MMKPFVLKIYSGPALCTAIGAAIFVLNCLLILPAHAQFRGGKGDGFGIRTITSANLAEPIFRGAKGDGFAQKTTSGASIGEGIFVGGKGDGHSLKAGQLVTIGNFMFQGGKGDGYQVSTKNQASMGEDVFAGGKGDGYSTKEGSTVTMGFSIYVGNKGDGHGHQAVAQKSLGEEIFSGGIADGYSAKESGLASLGFSIYVGNKGDGHGFQVASQRTFGESIFAGGKGDGFSMKLAGMVPLPLSLLSFQAKWVDQDASISWQTVQESNIELYKVHREISGYAWETVLSTFAKGGMHKNIYNTFDHGIRKKVDEKGIIYHLWEYNVKGDSAEVGIALLKGERWQMISMYPSSDFSEITVVAKEITKGSMVQMYSMDGKLVKQCPLAGEEFTTVIPVFDLARAQYIVHLVDGHGDVLFARKLHLL